MVITPSLNDTSLPCFIKVLTVLCCDSVNAANSLCFSKVSKILCCLSSSLVNGSSSPFNAAACCLNLSASSGGLNFASRSSSLASSAITTFCLSANSLSSLLSIRFLEATILGSSIGINFDLGSNSSANSDCSSSPVSFEIILTPVTLGFLEGWTNTALALSSSGSSLNLSFITVNLSAAVTIILSS